MQEQEWVMRNVIPQVTGLTVNGIYHRYTIEKDPNKESTVRICNENPNNTGTCTYERVDVWGKGKGSTKIGYDAFGGLGSTLGNGSITATGGDAELSDTLIWYDFVYDTCDDPINDPRCPNYESALLKYLQDNGLLDDPEVNDPFKEEYIQNQLAQQAEVEEVEEAEEVEEEEKEEETLQEQLAVGGATDKIASVSQQNAMMLALSQTPKLNSYYAQQIQGGEYKETIVLPDSEIVDNKRALRSLASDAKHKEMVRSQYDK